MSLTAAATSTADVLKTLPAQFLALCLLNLVFIGGVLWFLDRENSVRVVAEQHYADIREHVIMPVVEACLKRS